MPLKSVAAVQLLVWLCAALEDAPERHVAISSSGTQGGGAGTTNGKDLQKKRHAWPKHARLGSVTQQQAAGKAADASALLLESTTNWTNPTATNVNTSNTNNTQTLPRPTAPPLPAGNQTPVATAVPLPPDGNIFCGQPVCGHDGNPPPGEPEVPCVHVTLDFTVPDNERCVTVTDLIVNNAVTVHDGQSPPGTILDATVVPGSGNGNGATNGRPPNAEVIPDRSTGCEGCQGCDCNVKTQELQEKYDDEHWLLQIVEGGFVIMTVLALTGFCFYVGTMKKPRPPSTWGTAPYFPFSDNYYSEVDVTHLYKEQVQRLLDLTTKPEKMGRGRDGAWMTHRGFEVLKVTQIENGRVWTEYATRRKNMTKVDDLLRCMDGEWRKYSQTVLKTVDEVFETYRVDPKVSRMYQDLGLDKTRNERLMFHGCPNVGALDVTGELMYDVDERSPCFAIKKGGFDERLGSVRGMYGAGSYFADMASKADQYGGRYNQPGAPEGSVGEVATMFLARVCLGVPYMTTQSLEQLRRPPCIDGHFDLNLFFNEDVKIGKPWHEKGVKFAVCDHKRFDSVMGDFMVDEKERLYREYVVYQRTAYPEFCVTYKRVAARK